MPTHKNDRARRSQRRTPTSTWRPDGPITRGNRAGSGYPAARFDEAMLTPLMPIEVLATLRIRVSKKRDSGPEGPKHREWNKRYRASLGKKLVELGFSKKIIKQILDEYADATEKTFKGDKKAMLKFIVKWLTKLLKVKGAIEQEYKEEGAAPKWGD